MVLGGRDAAVCYANRAAARLMTVAAAAADGTGAGGAGGVAAADEVREALVGRSPKP